MDSVDLNYQNKIDQLYKQSPSFQVVGGKAYHPGLDVMHSLDHFLSNPHKSYKTIHVTGTNGKGSVSSFLASVLAENGYSVGLYTSPHLADFRERAKIIKKVDNKIFCEYVTKDFVVSFLDKIALFIEQNNPSFFEITTALAFDFFAYSKIDIAIIEVGLGGRLDSTNIITPILSVITSIGLDHMEILGDTLDKIAYEKGGIIKESIPVVVGKIDDSPLKVLKAIAENLNAPLSTFDESVIYNFPIKSMDLCGDYQVLNLSTTLTAINILSKIGYNLEPITNVLAICNAAKNTLFRGRWDKVHVSPTIYCDIAHNVHGLTPVMVQLSNEFSTGMYGRLVMIIGMASDKVNDQIKDLLPQNAEYYFTNAQGERAMPSDQLAERFSGLGDKRYITSSVEEALKSYMSVSRPNDLVYVGGSSYVVAEVLTYFE